MIRCQVFNSESIRRFHELSLFKYEERDDVSNVDFIRNKHLDNPDGSSLLLELVESDEVTGRIVVLNRRSNSSTVGELVGNPVDLLSISKGPFGGISLYREAIRKNQLVSCHGFFHTSNPKSEIFYRNALRMKPIFELDYRGLLISLPMRGFHFLVLNGLLQAANAGIIALLKIIAGKSNVAISKVNDYKDDMLSEIPINQDDQFLFRDAARLNWRFKSIKGLPTYDKYIFSRANRSLGYLVTREINQNGFVGVVIVDYLFDSMSFRELANVYLALFKEAGNANLIFTIGNFKNQKQKVLFTYPFVRIPKRFRPQAFPIYTPQSEAVPSLSINSYFTLFDLDVM